jgi:hypothetical protein
VRISNEDGTLLLMGTDTCGLGDSSVGEPLGDIADDANTKHECIVVKPATKTVRVTLLAEGLPERTEDWAVERTATSVSFRRPNGLPVVPSIAVAVAGDN